MANLNKSTFDKIDGFLGEIEKLTPYITKWEGGYVNDPLDKGGPTNMGVTLATWKAVGYDKTGDGIIDKADIKKLNNKDFEAVLKRYWNLWKADDIENQSVANILVDWVWTSGRWGIIIPQRTLGLVADGIVGPKTIAKMNGMNQEHLFKLIYQEREKYISGIVRNNPSQKRFFNGWMNRLRDFKYKC